MSKKKRPRSARRRPVNPSQQPGNARWSDLEQSFFSSAPPDVPGPAVEPERFDDLSPTVTSGPQLPAGLQRLGGAISRLIATLAAPRLSLRNVTIAVASLILLIGLSAAVFASHR